MIEALRLEARRLSWREGWAHEWALDEGQRKWRQDFINAPPLSSTVWNIGRQRGKSYDATFLNIEAGCVIRDAMLRYCAKTKDSALNIVMPSWDALVATIVAEPPLTTCTRRRASGLRCRCCGGSV